MAVIRLTVVGIIVSALRVVAHAQEGEPCPSRHQSPTPSGSADQLPGQFRNTSGLIEIVPGEAY
jgi:hypothetical protein